MFPLDDLEVVPAVTGHLGFDPATLIVNSPFHALPQEMITRELGSTLDDPQGVVWKLQKHEISFAPLHPLWVPASPNDLPFLTRKRAKDLVETIVRDHFKPSQCDDRVTAYES